MKRCPSCNRTYYDETISFCLEDGSLLSASYDPSKEEPPPTEIIPPATRPAVPPTQPGKAPVRTITSLPGLYGVEKESPARARARSPILWIIAGLCIGAVVAGLLVAVFITYNRSGGGESQVVSSQEGVLTDLKTPTPTPVPTPIATPAMSSPAARPTPSPSRLATPTPTPVHLQPAGPAPAPADDSNRIFSGTEVDSRARILSKPEPQYTEEARKNQISGTVMLKVVLARNGSVTTIQVLSGLPDGLSERAVAAARQIKFIPAMKDGHAVSMYFQLEYNFNLY